MKPRTAPHPDARPRGRLATSPDAGDLRHPVYAFRYCWLTGLWCCLALLGSSGCASPGPFSPDTWYTGVHVPAPARLQADGLCAESEHHRVYYILFGTMMLYRTRPEQLFPDPARYVYLIEQKKTASDWFLSILLGSLLSVTRTSLYVTRCDLAAGGKDIARYLRPPIDGSTGETAGPPARDATPAGAKSGPRDSTDPELQATIQKRIDAARERAEAARRRAEAARQATEP